LIETPIDNVTNNNTAIAQTPNFMNIIECSIIQRMLLSAIMIIDAVLNLDSITRLVTVWIFSACARKRRGRKLADGFPCLNMRTCLSVASSQPHAKAYQLKLDSLRKICVE
jgi:hypothetical protein